MTPWMLATEPPRVVRGNDPMADVNAGTNRLIGRDRELATLGSFLGEAVVDGATLLLTGEPGVGKTALLVAAAEMATRGRRPGDSRRRRGVRDGRQLRRPAPARRPVVRRSAPSPAVQSCVDRGCARHRLRPGTGPPRGVERIAGAVPSGGIERPAAHRHRRLALAGPCQRCRRRASSVGDCRAAGSGCSVPSGPASAASSNAPGCRSSTSHRSWRPTRWSCWLASSSTCRPVSAGTSSTRRKAIRWRCSSSPRRRVALDAAAHHRDLGHEPRGADVVRRPGSSGSPSRRDACSCSPCSTAPATCGVLAATSGAEELDDLGPAERDHLVVVDDRSGEMRFRHPMIKSVVVERSTHDERRAAHLRLAELFADQPERRGHHLAEAAFAPDEDDRRRGRGRRASHPAARRRRRRHLQAAAGGRSQPEPKRPEPAAGRRGVRRRPLRRPARQLVGAAARRSAQGSDARRDAPRGGRHRLSPPQQRRQRGDDASAADRRHRVRPGRARTRTATDSRRRCTRWCCCATTPGAPSTGRRFTMRCAGSARRRRRT